MPYRIAWYQLLFEHAIDGLLLTRPDGSLLAANPSACTILGYSEQELFRLGRIASLLAADSFALDAAINHGRRHGLFQGTLKFVKKDGTIFPADIASQEFVDDRGQPLTSIIFRDASATLQAQAAIAESEERYRTLFLTSPDAVTVTDLADGRYVDINEGFTHIYGWTRAEAIGRTSRDLEIWQNAGDRGPFIEQVSRSGGCENLEAHFQSRDRKPLTALVSSRVITVLGRRCILTVTRDISQRKKTEVELDQHRHHLQELVDSKTHELVAARDAANAANLAKGAFLANMSHEIRTPLNAIIGLTHLMKRDTQEALQGQRLAKIDDAARHLLQVINDILDLSKIDAGKMTLENIDFSLDSMLHTAINMVSVRAREKGLELMLDADHLPARMRGDPTRLAQALINLLANAVKFTTSGWVRLRGKLLRETATHHEIHFEVEDTGEGVAPEHQSMLFQAFQQADSSAMRHHGGTGLGLALTRHLASMMDGTVGMSSRLGEGSKFWFTARLARATQAGDRGASPRMPGSGERELRRHHAGQRVLLADDNKINQEIANELLSSTGLVVEIADDGQRALEMARARQYDAILMDVQMPRMDGLTATRAIRGHPGANVPIIAMTANAFGEDRAACLAAGMNDHIAKPMCPDQLYEALLRWLPLLHTRPESTGAAACVTPGNTENARSLLQRLADVPNFELSDALARAAGREATLRRVLACFASTYQSGESAMLRSDGADAEIFARWRAACHSLRGACGSVGAKPLLQQIEAFEVLVGTGVPAESLQGDARALNAALQKLSAALASALAE